MRGLLLAGLLLVALATPAVLGQVQVVQGGYSFQVDRATLALRESANTLALREVNAAPTDSNCGSDLIAASADGRSFTFAESNTQTGCAEALYDIMFPAGASTARISFLATRSVDNPGGLQTTAFQEFRLHYPDGTTRREDVFQANAGTVPDPRLYERSFLLPPVTTNVTLGWFFQEAGEVGTAALDPGTAAYGATVSDIRVEVDGIVLDPPVLAIGRNETMDEDSQTAEVMAWANVTLPAGALGPQRLSSLSIVLRSGPRFVDIIGPDGLVPSDEILAERVGEEFRFTAANSTVARQGVGTYSFRFALERALPPPVAVNPPTTIEPFYYTMLLLPAPAAILALYSGAIYRREAEGRYKRVSTGILALIVTGIVYYLLLLAYALFGAGRQVMTILPLKPEATLVYVQLLVLLLVFIVAAVVVGRYLAKAMRRDIETRRLQEDRLRRSNEELERFAYVASHDLQEPLRKVAGFTSLLQRRYKGRLDRDADEMIQYAVDGATRMQALIRDILAYSRVGSKELDLKPIEVGPMLELVVSDLGVKIKEEKADVSWDALPTVEADAGQVRQILQNLVDNAIKYRHPNRRPRVRVTAKRDGTMWRFAVSDNGQGIPADKLNDIFGVFRRLHGSEVPGTGIGLAVAKKAVERHGGTISAESREGKGSTFRFTLPAQGAGRALAS